MPAPLRLAAVAALLALAAPARASDLVPYAPVEIRPAAPPRRFEAPLPRVKDFSRPAVLGWTAAPGRPPVAHVRDLLCAGDPAMWRRARTALEASVRRGATWPEVLESYGWLVHDCKGDPCFAVPLAAEGRWPATLPAWLLAARCGSPAAAALFERSDVPPKAMLDRARAVRFEGVTPRSPAARVGAAALEILRTGPDDLRREAAMAAVDCGDAGTVDAVVELARTARDERVRGDLWEALAGSDDPRAQAAAEHCRVSMDAARRCGMRGWSPLMQPGPAPEPEPDDLAWRVRERNVDEAIDGALPARRAELLAALDGCAREDDRGDFDIRWYRALCLHGLARVDRAAAVAAAPTLARLPAPETRELVTALTRYPEPGALEARLRALGLPAAPGPRDFTAREVLIASGAAADVDLETSQFPNEHDTALRRLWALCGHGLPGAVFEEVPPADRERGRYTLRAYVGGKRYQTRAENLGDWYDIDAVVGLLNAVERDRGVDRRFVLVATLDEGIVVACGPEAGLRAAMAEGLLVPGTALGPVEAGKAAEQGVLQLLPAR